MAIKWSPGCGCCGCEIFLVENVYDSDKVDVTEDGWRIVRNRLPRNGNWRAGLSLAAYGYIPESARFELALFKDDGSIFAKAHEEYLREYTGNELADPPVPSHLLSENFRVDWNDGATVIEDKSLVANEYTEEDTRSEEAFGYLRYFVARPACGLYMERDLTDRGDVYGASPYDPDADHEVWYRVEEGFPLPLGTGDLAAAGPLRLGVRLISGFNGLGGENVNARAVISDAVTITMDETPIAGDTPTDSVSKNLLVDASEITPTTDTQAANNSIQIDETAITPPVTPVIYIDIPSGNGLITQSEIDAPAAIEITGSVANVSAGATVDVTLNGETYSTTVAVDLTWSVTVPDIDAEALSGRHIITAEVTALSISATRPVYREPDALQVTFPEDSTEDGFLTADEYSSTVLVRVDLPIETYEGDKLSITDGTTTHAIDVDATIAADLFVIVSFSRPGDGLTLTVTATHTRQGPVLHIRPINSSFVGADGDNVLRGAVALYGTSQRLKKRLSGVTLLTATVNGTSFTFRLYTNNTWQINLDAAFYSSFVDGTDLTVTLNDARGFTAEDSRIVHTFGGRPDLAIEFIEDKSDDGALTEDEFVADGNVAVRVDLPATVQEGESLTITDGATTHSITLDANHVFFRYALVEFAQPGGGETLSVTASHTYTTIRVTIDPVNGVDKIAANNGIESPVVISGTAKGTPTATSLTVTFNGGSAVTTGIDGNGNWGFSVQPSTWNTFPASTAIVASVTVNGVTYSDTRIVAVSTQGFALNSVDDAEGDGDITLDDSPSGDLLFRIDLPQGLDEVNIGDAVVIQYGDVTRTLVLKNVDLNRTYASFVIPRPEDTETVTVTATLYDGSAQVVAFARRLEEESRNEECDHPVICPVTHPHYATPRWDVSEFLGGWPLNSISGRRLLYRDCSSLISRDHADLVFPESSSLPAVYLDLDAYSGSDLADFMEFSTDVNNWKSNPITYAADNPQLSAPGWDVTIALSATENPSEWQVNAHFSVFSGQPFRMVGIVSKSGNFTSGFTATQTATYQGPYNEGRFEPTSGSAQGDPVFVTTGIEYTAGELFGLTGQPFDLYGSISYQKRIPKFTGEPPSISLGNADRIINSGGFGVLYTPGTTSPGLDEDFSYGTYDDDWDDLIRVVTDFTVSGPTITLESEVDLGGGIFRRTYSFVFELEFVTSDRRKSDLVINLVPESLGKIPHP